MRIEQPILLAAQRGDPIAMRDLLIAMQPDIRRYARYQCSRATAIDDVVQETLIIVNRRLGSVNNLAAFGGWVARIIARLCLLLPLQALRGMESLLTVENHIDFSHHPTDDLRLDVARAIESLPDAYREVIVLRDFEELTIGEMATRLKLTREATKSRLHRARSMVREYLVAGGHDMHQVKKR